MFVLYVRLVLEELGKRSSEDMSNNAFGQKEKRLAVQPSAEEVARMHLNYSVRRIEISLEKTLHVSRNEVRFICRLEACFVNLKLKINSLATFL